MSSTPHDEEGDEHLTFDVTAHIHEDAVIRWRIDQHTLGDQRILPEPVLSIGARLDLHLPSADTCNRRRILDQLIDAATELHGAADRAQANAEH